ncbi:MAG TPA: hypothetical protein ENI05_06930 [Porticoccus sp.]|nr:hypothetical protein [Porticoccus sp.]
MIKHRSSDGKRQGNKAGEGQTISGISAREFSYFSALIVLTVYLDFYPQPLLEHTQTVAENLVPDGSDDSELADDHSSLKKLGLNPAHNQHLTTH